MKILITGATGFIGKALGKKLYELGHEIFVISRDREKAKLELPFACEVIETDLNLGTVSDPCLKNIEGVVHLAGENVGEGLWTAKKKNAILVSRQKLTLNLMESLKQSKNLKVLVAASAIGYYGDTQDHLVDENAKNGQGFLAEVCKKWETQIATNPVAQRTVILRLGLVLNSFGGAFLKMLAPFQMGAGAALGSGRQWMSWIHLDDLVALFAEAVTKSSFAGVYNAVAPEPVTNQKFSEVLAKGLNAHLLMNAPSLVLKIGLGEKSHIVLDSQRVSCAKVQATGFEFKYTKIDLALADCCEPYAKGDFVFYAEQFIPQDIEQVFAFFSEAHNLEKITPDYLNFKIEKLSSNNIQQGTTIDYNLKIHGVPVKWKTLIDLWKPPYQFVDTQLRGPYKKWHHTHSFIKLGSGTLMIDLVKYRLPMGILGELVGGGLVRSDVDKIFKYRRKICMTLI